MLYRHRSEKVIDSERGHKRVKTKKKSQKNVKKLAFFFFFFRFAPLINKIYG